MKNKKEFVILFPFIFCVSFYKVILVLIQHYSIGNEIKYFRRCFRIASSHTAMIFNLESLTWSTHLTIL